MSELSDPAPDPEGLTMEEAQRLCAELKTQLAQAKMRVQQAFRELESRTQASES